MVFVKGFTPWNKGKSSWAKGKKFSKEHKEKIAAALKNENNGQWKGDNVGLGGLHKWVKRRLKKPERCQNCSIKTIELDLANISQEYKRELTDWEWLCRSCHMHKDNRIKNLQYQ